MFIVNNAIFYQQNYEFFMVYELLGKLNILYFEFANKLRNNDTIKIFNYNNCKIISTYIDEIVVDIIGTIDFPKK